MKHTTALRFLLLLVIIFTFSYSGYAQMITGVWQGRINKQRVEVKIILKGDSLTGTSYYYQSTGNYKRYSIKGYYDGRNNEAVWWDDELLEENRGRIAIGAPGRTELISRADFNCPGVDDMRLDGSTASRHDESKSNGEVHIKKVKSPVFPDEWDDIIQNYTRGGNNPLVIDSVEQIARRTPTPVENKPVSSPVSTPTVAVTPAPVQEPIAKKPAPLTIEDKFRQRTKVPTLEIPLIGDSIQLHFYDNAEIDGDSISLFLNDRLIFEHIFLTDKPFVVNLAVSELLHTNELVMVAENLGSIPPNTSLMIAYVNGQRYEARLVSTEGSSAMIRFKKE